MLLLVTYDVNTENEEGKRRLRKVARLCEANGQRVQNSVFECTVDNAQMVVLRADLINAIDPQYDSLRLYRLGNNYRQKVEAFGVAKGFCLDEPLII